MNGRLLQAGLTALLLVYAGAAVGAHVEVTETPVVQGPGAESYDYAGFFEPVGRKPKGFEKFANFMIRSTRGKAVDGAVITSETDLIYEFVEATLEGDRLTFSTKKVRGVSYSFVGRFLQPPPISERKGAVVEGTLTRYRNGRKTAGAAIKFRHESGGEEGP
jgi:hypothetical protein